MVGRLLRIDLKKITKINRAGLIREIQLNLLLFKYAYENSESFADSALGGGIGRMPSIVDRPGIPGILSWSSMVLQAGWPTLIGTGGQSFCTVKEQGSNFSTIRVRSSQYLLVKTEGGSL